MLRNCCAVWILICMMIGVPSFGHAEDIFNPVQKQAIESVVRDYLLKNPALLRDVIAELDKLETRETTEKRKTAVQTQKDLIYNSSRQAVIGNPHGDVTIVEFFDYNCGVCRGALPDILDLIKNDGQLRIVLKEFPVLGPTSVEAAQVAVALRQLSPEPEKYLDFHKKMFELKGQANRQKALEVAKSLGFDVKKLEEALKSPEVQATLQENYTLAEAMGLNGTPSYVIGDEAVVGALGYQEMRRRIEAQRSSLVTGTVRP